MKKILIINVMALYSYGGRAVIKGAIRSLKENITNVQITFMSSHYEKEYKIYEKWNYKNVDLINHLWYKETNGYFFTLLFSSISALIVIIKFYFYFCFKNLLKLNNPYKQYDLVIDLTTDGPNDHYGLFIPLFSIFNIFLAILAKKPIVMGPASIGTFDKWYTKFLAKLVLNKVDLIIVREEITKEYLQKLELKNPKIYLTADYAFAMESVCTERIDEILKVEGINVNKKPIIGISASKLIHKYAFPNIKNEKIKYKEYINAIVQTIEYIFECLDCIIVLIPHSAAGSNITPNEDDYLISKELYEKVNNKSKLKFLKGEYDTDELKGIIGVCDIFIGFRMHSTIASTSMNVPTIAVVYGHKSHGIIGKMMEQEACLIEIGNYDPGGFLSEMKSKIDYVWDNQNSIREKLKERSKIAQEKAMLNGKLVKELLDSVDNGRN